MRDTDHGCDISDGNAPRIQVGVDILGNLVWRPAPAEVVADELRHPDQGGFVSGRPGQAGGAQLSEVRVADRIGSRNRSASDEGGTNQCRDGQSRQPARGAHSVSMGFQSGANMKSERKLGWRLSCEVMVLRQDSKS
jgi:hypothetical protein